jgi:FkbM family methyltransferase
MCFVSRLTLIRVFVRMIRSLLPGRGYTQRFPRLYKVFVTTVDRVLPSSPGIVKVNGHRMYVDAHDHGVDYALIFGGDHELRQKQLIMSRLTSGMCVVEIGANIGDYTLELAKKCGPAGKVYAFEPSPKAFSYLRKNVVLNGYRNVTLINGAVSDINGKVLLFEDSESRGNSSLFVGAVPHPKMGIEVETVALDSFAKTNEIIRLDFIKMDTQGAEHRILLGAAETLRKFRPWLCMEFWPFGIRQSGADPRELLGYCRTLGYRIAIICDGVSRLDQLPEESDERVFTYCEARGRERGFCDLLVYPT